MEHAARDKLRDLLTKSLEELQKAVGNYGALLSQLAVLECAIESGAVDTEVLEATQRAFPLRFQPLRGGTPTNDGLDDTRQLLVEINRIIELRRIRQS